MENNTGYLLIFGSFICKKINKKSNVFFHEVFSNLVTIYI